MTITYRAKGNIYLNLTNRCPCDCVFCIGRRRGTVFGSDLRLESEPALDEILHDLELAFLDGPAAEVVFAGLGEPAMRLDEVLAVVEWLRLRRLRSRLVTCGLGQLVNPETNVASALAAAGLDAASVSLVAHNAAVYNQLCRPVFGKAYRAVLAFAENCREAGIEVELMVVELPEVDIEACRSIAARMGAGFRVRPLVTSDEPEVGN